MTDDDVTRFMQFLIDNDVYKQFRNNIEDYRGEPFDEYMKLVKPMPIQVLVCGAFMFKEAPEGADFWKDVNMKWLEVSYGR